MSGIARPTGILASVVAGLLAFPALAHGASVRADFDGDGFDDLAIGVPLENLGGAEDAGAVHVIYGSGGGLTATGDQLWHQDSAGITGVAEKDDEFGGSLAAGNFDFDAYDDLAIGAPEEDLGGADDAGAVHVIYGSPSGLTATGDQLWHQDSAGIKSVAENGDRFGSSLTAGDFNGAGVADLAVGAPEEDLGGAEAGVVHAIYGSPGNGLTATGDQLWHQDSPDIAGRTEAFDHFGGSLTAGDFDFDAHDDLAVGVPGEDLGVADNAGAVHVIYGSGSGLAATRSQLWSQVSPGIAGAAETGDRFGSSLTAGDFDSDDADDLAVGAPGEDRGVTCCAGAVHAIYGSGSGLAAASSQLYHQDSPGIAGVAETGDEFGDALTAGDFDDDAADDLAIGVPDEDLGGPGFPAKFGVVHAIYGSGSGLTVAGSQLWSQDVPGIAGVAETGDEFGGVLTAGDFDFDAADDLAIGVPGEGLGGAGGAGVVHPIYGSGSGLAATGSQLWHQDVSGILGDAEKRDEFGAALPG